jgi:hypothetical protein
MYNLSPGVELNIDLVENEIVIDVNWFV